MNAIIGTHGLIGGYLKETIPYTHEFNSSNINQISDYKFDKVYIAAPTGNRLVANADANADLVNIQNLATALKATEIDTVILIGTVDSILRPNLPYGKNRLWLEEFVKSNFNSYIPRLSSLIHKDLKKNPLYDLKHNVYTDKINLDYTLQWYDLTNIEFDISNMINSGTREQNLVSEPIANREIVDKFFPSLNLTYSRVENITLLTPYLYTKDQIFNSIEQYLHV